MKALKFFRGQHIELSNSISAKPTAHQVFQPQTSQVSHAEILSYEVADAPDIQNDDGSFIFMPGYDRLV